MTALASVALMAAGWAVGSVTPRPPRYAKADPRSFLERQRLRASRAIDSVFRGDAPIAKALLVADQHEIPKAQKNRYADAGIVHMLSISGLHVAIVAAAIELLAQVARLPVREARIAAVVVIMGYVAVIGFPPPAVRSGIMVAVTTASSLAQRPTSRWASLALGALVPLATPATILDLGYLLSVLGIAGLIASGALAKRWLAPRLAGWRYALARGLLASTVATLVSAPLVAWAFGRISLIAPFTNLLADPILAVAQPMLFLALVLAPVGPVARFIADAVHPLLAAFELVAAWGAAVPFAVIAVRPSPFTLVLAGVASAAMLIACLSRFPARAALVACAALAGIISFS